MISILGLFGIKALKFKVLMLSRWVFYKAASNSNIVFVLLPKLFV
jgi:hypothetical protein